MIKFAFWTICCLLLAGCAVNKLSWPSPYKDVASLKDGDIVHIPTGTFVQKKDLMKFLETAKLVYVGETHDNVNAHRMQLEILKSLHDLHPGKVAVGMEMLRRPSQEAADKWSAGALEEKEWVRTWIDDWSNDFNYYRDILFYIRDNRIPLVALRASDDWVDAVKKKASGPVSDKGEGENGSPPEPLPEMDMDDPYHRAQIETVFKNHPTHGNDFEGFYRVQVLWDESMAQSVYDYLTSEKGLDKQMVVFAGAQHVENGFGIPRRVFRRLAAPYTIVIPVTLSSAENKPKTLGVTLPEVPLFAGDFAWVVTHEDLKEERVYLGVIIDSTDEGVKILRTTKGSVAEKAGMQTDDIIINFDGEEVKTSFDLTFLVGKKKPGDQGVVAVLRGNETLRFEVTFEKGDFHM